MRVFANRPRADAVTIGRAIPEDESNAGTTIAYTASGQRGSSTNGSGTILEFYDERDRLVLAIDGQNREITFTYDAAGNMLTRKSPTSLNTYTYDALDRLFTTVAVTGEATRTVLYRYDAVGNRVEMPSQEGTKTCDKPARREHATSMVCDEYPFATTTQRGPVNYAYGQVSLRLLPIPESDLQRYLLRDFYRDCVVSPDGRSVELSFLALALPIPAAPSGYTCRRGGVYTRGGAP